MKALSLHLGVSLQESCIQQTRYALSLSLLGLAFALLLSACSPQTPLEVRVGTHNIATQQFTVDATQGAVIQGMQGAILAIPAGAFMDSLGNTVQGKVQIQLKEANRHIDILTGGLITQTGDKMLASGGMYMIDATANGQHLRLNPEVGIYASLPTQRKDAAMGLYKGEFSESKLDWKLTGQGEEYIPECDRDKASRAKCKKCERLAKMANRIKPGKKPKQDEYWVKRHVWEDGKLYFYSSGSKSTVLTQDQLDECKSYLEASEKGQQLLATVGQYKAEWKDRIGEYYDYKLNALGWYNIDKLVKEELVTFAGRVVNPDGEPVPDAKVHLYCKDNDLNVHVTTIAADGSFQLDFAPGRSFILFAYEKGQLGKQTITLNRAGQTLDDLTITQVDPENHSGFLDELL